MKMKYFFLFIKKTIKYLLKPLSLVPAILMMCLIFTFSSQDGITSSKLSQKVSRNFLIITNDVLDKNWDSSQIQSFIPKIEHYVRKTAHITEYFLLALSVALPMYVYGIRGIYLLIYAGSFCLVFAGMDEWHQSLVSGRSPALRDVCIDSFGILLGVTLSQFLCFIGRNTVFLPLKS